MKMESSFTRVWYRRKPCTWRIHVTCGKTIWKEDTRSIETVETFFFPKNHCCSGYFWKEDYVSQGETKWYFYDLFIWKTESENLSTDSFIKWHRSPGRTRRKPEAQNLSSVLHTGCRDPGPWAVVCCWPKGQQPGLDWRSCRKLLSQLLA